VFPAAGYISMAVKAARIFAGEQKVKTIKIQDFVIGRAIVFNDGS
jgi:hybrid polyketide synthase / nonribosomal peptide synthetase ACE1